MAPAQKARAAFEPIPYDFDIEDLVNKTEHMRFAMRFNVSQIKHYGLAKFEQIVKNYVVNQGKPLVVEGFADDMLDPWLFSRDWLVNNAGDQVMQARDLNKDENIPISLRHYLNHMHAVASRHFRQQDPSELKYRQPQRMYLKDIDCPEVWRKALERIIPKSLFYLNEGQTDDDGREPAGHPPHLTLDRKYARRGDLMSSLPEDMRAENMQCYIGHEGTYTPAHREMCGSLGHNLMVEASGVGSVDSQGNPERPGSSIWFMTETDDRQTVAEYWQSILGHDIEVEKHFASISAWRKAPFSVHVVVQEPGDLVIIPSLAPHQVWNRGTRTMKAAWNRTTPETLQYALSEAVPKARMVCRDEQYKNKAIVYYSLDKYAKLLTEIKAQADALPPASVRELLRSRGKKILEMRKDFDMLLDSYEEILLSEMWDPESPQVDCQYLPFDSNVTCAYCRCNIFNRFLSCPNCTTHLDLPEPEPYDVCMDCYVMGRSCYCISGHKWVEQWKWSHLEAKYEEWRLLHNALQANVLKPQPLRKKTLQQKWVDMSKRSLADVTRHQLQRRPFQDPLKPKDQEDKPTDEQVINGEASDNESTPARTRNKKRPGKFWVKHQQCHVCKNPHENWKVVKCSQCPRYYCYGTLFRGRGEMPQEIMENPDWVCPHCNNVCFAGTCAKLDTQKPAQPKGTSLGHDTRAIADIRSVETIISLNTSNKYWIRPDGEGEESFQIRTMREEAEAAKKDKELHEDPDDEDDYAVPAQQAISADQIDPELRDESVMVASLTQYNNGSGTPNATPGQSHDGYVPAATGGFASQYRGTSEDSQNVYPGPDNAGAETGQKRTRDVADDEILMEVQKKRSRPLDGFSFAAKLANSTGTEAGRQFQKDKYHKALERARQQGRYHIYKASLEGSSRILKFKLPPASLASIVNVAREPVANGTVRDDEDGLDVLRSDIGPKGKPDVQNLSKANKKTEAVNKGSTRVKTKRRSGHADSDADQSENDHGSDVEDEPPAPNVPTNGRRRGASAYLRKKHGGDADAEVLEALPMTATRKRAEHGSGKGLTDAAIDVDVAVIDDSPQAEQPGPITDHPMLVPASEPEDLRQAPTAMMVAPRMTEAEANLRAKMSMMDGAGDDIDDDRAGTDEGSAEPVAEMNVPETSKAGPGRSSKASRKSAGVADVARHSDDGPAKKSARKSEPAMAKTSGPATFGRSIFDRKKGPGGKKIRVVGKV